MQRQYGAREHGFFLSLNESWSPFCRAIFPVHPLRRPRIDASKEMLTFSYHPPKRDVCCSSSNGCERGKGGQECRVSGFSAHQVDKLNRDRGPIYAISESEHSMVICCFNGGAGKKRRPPLATSGVTVQPTLNLFLTSFSGHLALLFQKRSVGGWVAVRKGDLDRTGQDWTGGGYCMVAISKNQGKTY